MIVRMLSIALLLALPQVPFTSAQSFHAFLWTPTGGMQDLGVPKPYTGSAATAINSSGEVAGYLTTADGNALPAVWTSDKGWRTLPSNGGGALGINDRGQVVGNTLQPNGQYHAVLWTVGGGAQDLGTLGGLTSSATAISNTGQVVGYSYMPSMTTYHAFSWTSQQGMRDLGTFSRDPAALSAAFSINRSGDICGYATRRDAQQDPPLFAAVWRQSQIHPLLTVGGNSNRAYAVSNSGQVVGTFSSSSSAAFPFIWTQSGGSQDLGLQPGTSSTIAFAVNDLGQVAGAGLFSEGYRAFIWKPISGYEDLGTLGGPTSFVSAINGSGQVVGFSEIK